MTKKTILTYLLALIATAGQAEEKKQVWENPTTEYGTTYGDGFFILSLDVTKVELKDTETVVHITARRRPDSEQLDHWFQFAGDTYLKVGNERFTIVSADNIELNKHVYPGKDGKREMAFHFPPLPQGTKVFDFIEGDGWSAFQIKGIKPIEERWKQLFPSYWRDNQTGDWKIAFLDDCALYDCKFWTYKQRDVNPKTGEAKLVLTNGNDELKVTIGKNKKGTRTMQIGNQKAMYSMMTDRFMPDYPVKDLRPDFVDTGYKADTVTIVGWIKDMPEHFKNDKNFSISYQNFLTDQQETVYADLDSLGRFTAKFPLANSSEFFMDWGRCFIRTMLEPDKTYFMLYDFKEGRRFVMGDDSRLQNELFRFPLPWCGRRLEKGEDFDHYIAWNDSVIQAQHAAIDELCQQHPTLSARFSQYRKDNVISQLSREFGQSRFDAPNYEFTAHARQYAYDTFWTKMVKPYTLHRDFSGFMRDYLDDASRARNAVFSYSIRENYQDYASNDEELALLTRWAKWIDEVRPIVDAEPTIEDKIRKSHEIDSLNADLIKEVDEIINAPKNRKLIYAGMKLNTMKEHVKTLDSLHADPFIKDVWLFRQAYASFEHERTSLLPNTMDSLKAIIKNPECQAMLEKQNDYYLAIENREFDKLVIKSSDNLKDLSEGEALLKKILEPYKGKFVLLDIWGTWCGPCKEALSHSTEEYVRLKDYDIEFLYLANGSPQDSWENVIKEYNVSGDNVAHYNLPREQQDAIERHLNVHSFPTYKLFNREGQLLDLQVDARDLDNLVQLLEKMK
jgi:thiol-disulfide isomerase/thioredoxin